MFKKLAYTLSVILHPVFLPSIMVLALNKIAPLPLFYMFMNEKLFGALFSLILSYTALIPILFIFLLKRMGFVTDMEVTQRHERPKVYLFTSGFYFALAYFLLSKGSVFMPTSIMIATIAVVIFGLFLFSFFDKISAHTSGMGGVIGILVAISIRYSDRTLFPYILIAIVVLGCIASSRLYLKAHNLRQITLGALWGIVIGFLGTYNYMIL